jgi:hypothetical protein
MMLIMIFIGTLPSSFQGGTSGIAFGIIFGIIMYMIFAKRIYNEEYQTDPFPNMSSLLDKYQKYYIGSYDNKVGDLTSNSSVYKNTKKSLNYDKLSDSINFVKGNLEKAIAEYSKAYIKVNTDGTLEPNEDPFNKKVRKAKEFKNKVGKGVSESKVGKFVSEKIKGKKPNSENYGIEMSEYSSTKNK